MNAKNAVFKWRNAVIGISLLLAAHAATAQPTGITETQFEAIGASSLPRGVVPTFVQDKLGFFWIATGDGLVRFDGYKFRPIELQSPDPAQRNLGWIRALLAGADGNVWIGTESRGLALYDATKDAVRLIRAPGGDAATPSPSPTIRALAQDGAGRIYAGSIGGGIEVFNPKDASVSHLRQSGRAGDLPDNRVQALLVDRDQNLWAGTWAGLSLRRTHGADFEPIRLPASGHDTSVVQALAQASDGRLWVGTQSGAVYVVEPTTLKVQVLVSGTVGSPPVTSFVEDDDQRMWVGTSGGLALFDALRLEPLRRLTHDIRKPSGLAGDNITTLLRDRAGWVWVGGFGLGLQRHNPNNKAISMRTPDLDANSPYRVSDVRSLLQVDNGEIWAAQQGDSVVVFDKDLRATGTLALATGRRAEISPAGRPVAAPREILSMVQRRDQNVWLGADSELLVFEPHHRLRQTLQVPTGPVRRLFESRDESLWIGTPDGVYRLPRGTTQVMRVGQAQGDLNGEVHAFAQGPDDTVWVGTSSGLFTVDPATNQLRPVRSTPQDGLASSIVIGLLFDAQGALWVDTGVAGLHRMTRWDGALAQFDRVSYRHGLTGKPYGANLMSDRQGRIWTQMGMYDPNLDKLNQLHPHDGANLGTGWFFSYASTVDGRLLFGGSKGILVVSPELFVKTPFAAPVVVTDLRVNGERKNFGTAHQKIDLAPTDRSFSVEFAALDLVDPSSLQYSYRLQGFADDWVAVGAGFRFASYSNLSPGSYTLQVRAANRYGDWSAHELSIPVYQMAAWWQTLWFKSVCVAIVVLLFTGLLRLRTHQLRLRQIALEAMVQERTEELAELNLELQLQAYALTESSLVDSLTGLYNRRFFAQHIDADLSLSQRALEEMGATNPGIDWTGDLVFLMVDIDHFKRINDTHGHAVGDEILIQVAQRLQNVFRDSDYLVRWGGEEFLGVARQTSRANAGEVAERLRMAIAGSTFVTQSGLALPVTVSVGFAAYPLSTQHPRTLGWEDLFKLTDSALYLVKANGRNGWLGLNDTGNLGANDIRELVQRPLLEVIQDGLVFYECSATVLDGLRSSGSPPSNAVVNGTAMQSESGHALTR